MSNGRRYDLSSTLTLTLKETKMSRKKVTDVLDVIDPNVPKGYKGTVEEMTKICMGLGIPYSRMKQLYEPMCFILEGHPMLNLYELEDVIDELYDSFDKETMSLNDWLFAHDIEHYGLWKYYLGIHEDDPIIEY